MKHHFDGRLAWIQRNQDQAQLEPAQEMLDPATVRDRGYFNPSAVEGLVRRCKSGRSLGFRENQALVAVLSTHVWDQEFMRNRNAVKALDVAGADVVMREPAAIGSQSLAG